MGESVVIYDPDGEFRVTAFDANHCPGNLCSFVVVVLIVVIWGFFVDHFLVLDYFQPNIVFVEI